MYQEIGTPLFFKKKELVAFDLLSSEEYFISTK